jgi:HSP20 family protein
MRWDPFADFDRMLELVAGRGTSGNTPAATRAMPMDLYRSGDEYVVEMELPGVDPSAIDISIDRNLITVEAEAHSSHEEADEQIVCERRHVRYRRQLYLGDNVDTDNIQAEFNNGVLRLRIPIAQEQRSRKIEVEATDDARRLTGESAGEQATSEQGNQRSSRSRARETQPASSGAS